MNKIQKQYLNAFNLIEWVGPAGLGKISRFFSEDFKKAWGEGMSALKASGLSSALCERIIHNKKGIDPQKEWERLEALHIQTVVLGEERYPESLAHIAQPPFILYIRGVLDTRGDSAIGVVGSRNMTEYGMRATRSIVKNLATQNIVIVSGLARGIDAASHRAAIDAGGKTIAVLGGSIASQEVYPSQNRKLAEDIVKTGGAVISEFPLGARISKEKFPQRNRIISGLARGVVVIEAALKSGALITAYQALEQNREVFAIPGSLYSKTSEGTNILIQKGAKLVTCARDILEELGIDDTMVEHGANERKKTLRGENAQEQAIIDCLIKNEESVHIDALVAQTGMDISVVLAAITMMEFKGTVMNLGSNRYTLA